ncbi:Metallo-dependent phosphatase [Lentinus tigrinus ALCF2SS1-7]|uniref:Serine/threonine-protein phosphatase n=1 Tax=Lentinus tigrinus ALCF2SS1-6 TaxID=1328759 RepID=A0A5C2RZS7_9APHY|nr:Metallo-dependent phosphatase [Lentinus tigrinus ALCF2SS1-6]RPD79493.1 Metallo-dependent phosphatase [Lentinus tigrinus ALCF2SS1-7]
MSRAGSDTGYYPNAYHEAIQKQSVVVPPTVPSPTTNLQERQAPHITPPAAHIPTDEEFYVLDPHSGRHRPNVDLLKRHFFHEGRLSQEQALFILEQTTDLITREPNLLQVPSPVTVCGDIHGQYYDLMKVFEVGGSFEENNYLFLGDYVDRGCFGIECLLYLYALKLCYPNRLFLLRGNHECRHLTEYFTFKRECLHKYSPEVYDACIKSFQALPITALVDKKFFCVHGGISPELDTLRDIEHVDRFQEPASKGLLCDLLWADPIPNFGHEHDPTYERPHGLPPGVPFVDNHTRGCSYYFTYEAACKFLERNQLLGIFRGHEAQDAGYTMHRKTPTKKFPSVITIFSAPNYLDVYHNRGAVIKYKNKNITIRQYNATSHPYWLPNFMDAFTWSLPFVGAKITEMLLAILSVCSDQELESVSSEEEDAERARALNDSDSEEGDETRTVADLSLTPNEIASRRQEIKNKILAVGRMQRVFQLLREEAENATELAPAPGAATAGPPTSWPGGFHPPGAPDALGVHGQQVRRSIRTFSDARASDLANERMPQFDYTAQPALPLVPVPSMRIPGLALAAGGEGEAADGADSRRNMEELIKKALEEEGLGDGGMVERLADRIARGRRGARPRGLKRFETAP